jgi:RNA polymerase sigma factor (sigma-70 family)
MQAAGCPLLAGRRSAEAIPGVVPNRRPDASAGFYLAHLVASAMKRTVDQPVSIGAEAARRELTAVMRRLADGDRAALKPLYDRTSAKLYGICLRVLGDEADAQDTLQDIYLTVWKRAGLFDPDKASAITWLSVLARNRAIDRLRSRRAPAAELDSALDIADERPSALAVAEQAEDSRRLSHCLDELEERARSAIRSAFFDGATYPELAEREGVPLPTIKSWVRRGLIRLRGCLER